ncbi:MAG: hypothetical protein COB15_12890 [Flavobacteriales bacterium]|nr:MAG: hypothetical protein COB15_12890 [Flavobacteriales bacterium]
MKSSKTSSFLTNDIKSEIDCELILDEAYNIRHSDLALAFKMAEKGIKWAKAGNYSSSLIGAKALLSLLHALKGNLKTATNLIDQLLLKKKGVNDKHLARLYYSSALVLRRIGESYKSLTCYRQSNYYYNVILDYNGIAMTNNAIALWHIENEEFFEASNLLKEIISSFYLVDNKYIISTTYLYMAICHKNVGEHTKATRILIDALKIKKSIKDISGLAGIYHLLFQLAKIQNNNYYTNLYFKECASLIDTTNDYFIKIRIGKIIIQHSKEVKPELYIETLLSTEKLVTKYRAKDFALYIYKELSDWYEQNKDLASALIFQKKLNTVAIKKNKQKSAVTAELSGVLNQLNKEKEINEVLESHNKELIKSDKEKEELISEINHRVRNNLQVVMSLIKYSKPAITSYKKNNSINAKLLERVNIISLAHNHITSADNRNEFDLKNYLQDIVNYYKNDNEFNYSYEVNIKSSVNIKSLDTCIPIGFIVYEALSNSVEHGFEFSKKKTNRIDIEISTISGVNKLTINDNGVGFDIEKVDKDDFGGFGLIDTFTLQLDGKLSIDGENGGRTTVLF